MPADQQTDRLTEEERDRGADVFFFFCVLSLWLPQVHWETATSPGDDGGDMQRRPSAMRVATDHEHQSQGHWRLWRTARRFGRAKEHSEGGSGARGFGGSWVRGVEVMKWEGRDLLPFRGRDGMELDALGPALPRILCVWAKKLEPMNSAEFLGGPPHRPIIIPKPLPPLPKFKGLFPAGESSARLYPAIN